MSRTDLALELAEQIPADRFPPQEFSTRVVSRGPVRLTFMRVSGERAAREIGRPCGRYVTAEIPPLTDTVSSLLPAAEILGAALRGLLPPTGTVLVVGLGNGAITPDALGPQCVRHVLATRHIRGEYARVAGLSDLRPVATVESGVMGSTGLESGELTRGIVQVIDPVAVIAVDALAARSLHRLGCTVQMSDSGIVPGSGVGNSRKALDRELLRVPVISLGVPTVVDAGTLAEELTGRACPETAPRGAQMMVTPREVDLLVRRAAKLLAMTINAALQPRYDADELTEAAD